MKLIKSERGIKLPLIYYAENEAEWAKIPPGIPFIRGSSLEYGSIVKTLEFEILLKSALATGLDFNWEKLLREQGFEELYFDGLAYSENIEGEYSELGDYEIPTVKTTVKKLVSGLPISYVVDLEVLKNLEIIPTFLQDIERAIEINIHNGYKFNPLSYNKKLGLPIGDLEMNTSKKNLIIIDISSSIPKSISKTILALAKTMSIQFYADLLITGSKSTLYEYDNVDSLNITTIYSENGGGNDQTYFRELVSSEYRDYGTVIAFGDNHNPGMNWDNEYNVGNNYIREKQGKELCKWEVESIISFHTTSSSHIAGYAKWFDTDDVTFMENWVTYFN